MVHEVTLKSWRLVFLSIASSPGLPTIQFLIACRTAVLQANSTASDQKLDSGEAWEWGYP